MIGHRVPLVAVDVVYAWKKYEPEVTEWIKENCPHAKFISLEAAEILKNHGEILREGAKQEGISEEEAWARLWCKNKKTRTCNFCGLHATAVLIK